MNDFFALDKTTLKIKQKRIVEKSGAWFAYGGERLGQGRENAKQFLKDNPEIYKTIEERVRRELGMAREAEPTTV